MQASTEGGDRHNHLGSSLCSLSGAIHDVQCHRKLQTGQSTLWAVQDRARPICLAGEKALRFSGFCLRDTLAGISMKD